MYLGIAKSSQEPCNSLHQLEKQHFPYIYLSVVITATSVTSDGKQHQLPDFNIDLIDCESTSDRTRTPASDDNDSTGKQKLTCTRSCLPSLKDKATPQTKSNCKKGVNSPL